MNGSSKYRGLFVAMTVFLLVIAVVAGLNFYIATRVDQDAVSVNLSGRQRMLSQRIAKTIFLAQQAKEEAERIAAIEELRGAVKLFDTTLSGFRTGGEVTGGDGKPVVLAKAPVALDAISDAVNLWSGYQKLLGDFLDSPAPAQNDAALNSLGVYARTNNVKILQLMNDLTTALERQAQQRAATLRVIQLTAIVIALSLFAYVVFFSLRNLRRADTELVAAKAETDNILSTVKDGLFLVDRELTIGQQQSKSLEQILGVKSVAGRNLLDVLARMVPEKTQATAKSFLELLFGERVKESLMGEVNPLKEVEVSTPTEDGRIATRYLAFQFRRVLTDGQLTHLLVSTADVTSEVELRQELDRAKRRGEQQITLLTKMMHLGNDELVEFIDKMNRGLDEMNGILATAGTSRQGTMGKLAQVYRIVHTIKGDAAALDFEPIESWAHQIEDQVAKLRGHENLAGSDLLPLTVSLRDMYQQLEGVREMVDRLGQVRRSLDSGRPARRLAPVWNKAEMIARKVADREQKRVEFSINASHDVEIPDTAYHEVSDALVQLVRNAIVHGIEPPQVRTAEGKPAIGRVVLTVRPGTNRNIEIAVEDDGRGIDLERVRDKAITLGLASRQQAQAMMPKDLVRLLFSSGFSTKDDVTEDGGRGVGLDVVEQSIARVGGRVAVGSKPGQGSRFTLTIPQTSGVSA